MRTFLLTLVIFLLIKENSTAQVSVRESIRFRDTVEMEKYTPENNSFSILKLKMLPGEYHIQNIKDLKALNNQTITGIDLVYSDYPEGEDFSELNRLRILELYMFLPNAFNNPIIEWRIIKQTGVKSTGGLQNYFHGFTVYYRPMPSFTDERSSIMDIVEGKTPPIDSTLLKVFNRNVNWKDMLVVCDVTGSMSPYTAQLLFWIKSNQRLKTFKQIVFFNDDEEKSNDQTVRLDESGIWTLESSNSDKVISTAFEAMKEGGHYENDLEAICYAIKKYPENKQNVVLIADNWETPCDMRLVEYLKKNKIPVRIVVCGVTDRLNIAYLELAYATGGSIHTMEQDLTEIAKIGEGKVFKIGEMRFRMSGGRFVQL